MLGYATLIEKTGDTSGNILGHASDMLSPEEDRREMQPLMCRLGVGLSTSVAATERSATRTRFCQDNRISSCHPVRFGIARGRVFSFGELGL